ncbi:Atg28p/autophagy-related protein Atg28 [Blumeria hordei DH14]|uniref:Atg28p/autophagy-related protein Atg28 n=1 Tax=Blumeria graminis f. sp. hordei (strain DH14) TaxID=546991 RepID=N1JJ54_BLUG1|nr:Atg28p/autophagy-related protein Atg28 [Blumeria hordei DH14]
MQSLPAHDSIKKGSSSPSILDERSVAVSPPPSFYRQFHAPTAFNHARPRPVDYAAPLINSEHNLTTVTTSSLKNTGAGLNSIMHVSTLDSLRTLERQERAIQIILQELLDIQAACLMATQDDDKTKRPASEIGNQLKKHRSPKRTRPVRQPVKQPLGLQDARRGLLSQMTQLIYLKDSEATVLDKEIEQRQVILRQITSWKTKQVGLRRLIESNESHDRVDSPEQPSGDELKQLQYEETLIAQEIQEIRAHLSQMENRQRWLTERIQACVNQREAHLSSYRGALRELQDEIKEFLCAPPHVTTLSRRTDQTDFMSMPPSRRTLEMAQDWWQNEVELLELRRARADMEHKALESGAEMWESMIVLITEFEDALRTHLESQAASGNSAGPHNCAELLARLSEVTERLEDGLRTAEDQGWNLLICAISAEIAAIRKAGDIFSKIPGLAIGEMRETRGTLSPTHDDLRSKPGFILESETAAEPSGDGPEGRGGERR